VAGIVNTERPAELLDGTIGYLLRHGVRDLSLRPLAKAIGSSPRALLYHFGSKEGLVDRALTRLRDQQRSRYQQMTPPSFVPPSAGCREIWRDMTTPESERLFRLFFEVYSLALQQPKRFADFLRNSVEDWLDFIARMMQREGYDRSESREFATVMLAGFRGFMVDYCASRDRMRIDRALDLWLRGLDAMALRPPRPMSRRIP